MAKNAITVTGDKALVAKMLGLAPAAQKRVIKPAARAAGRPIRDLARQLAPRDTGLLSRTIEMVTRSGRNPGVMVQMPRRQKIGIPPEDKYYYPAIVEYGHKGAAAKPYMRPAWEMRKASSLVIFERELWKGVKREARLK